MPPRQSAQDRLVGGEHTFEFGFSSSFSPSFLTDILGGTGLRVVNNTQAGKVNPMIQSSHLLGTCGLLDSMKTLYKLPTYRRNRYAAPLNAVEKMAGRSASECSMTVRVQAQVDRLRN